MLENLINFEVFKKQIEEFITWRASGGNRGRVGWLSQLGVIGQVSAISILHTQRMLLRMLGEDAMQKTISGRGPRFSLNSGQSQGLFFSRVMRLDFPRINWNKKTNITYYKTFLSQYSQVQDFASLRWHVHFTCRDYAFRFAVRKGREKNEFSNESRR